MHLAHLRPVTSCAYVRLMADFGLASHLLLGGGTTAAQAKDQTPKHPGGHLPPSDIAFRFVLSAARKCFRTGQTGYFCRQQDHFGHGAHRRRKCYTWGDQQNPKGWVEWTTWCANLGPPITWACSGTGLAPRICKLIKRAPAKAWLRTRRRFRTGPFQDGSPDIWPCFRGTTQRFALGAICVLSGPFWTRRVHSTSFFGPEWSRGRKTQINSFFFLFFWLAPGGNGSPRVSAHGTGLAYSRGPAPEIEDLRMEVLPRVHERVCS